MHLGRAGVDEHLDERALVLPRTIESSTITARCPAISSSGLNLSLIPCRRSSWSGWMNVRPT